LPTSYNILTPSQLWILPPGAGNEPEKQMSMSEMVFYAEQQQFSFVAIKGEQNLMNVVKNSQPDPKRMDDVAYTRAVLDAMFQKLCIDKRRVYCTGYSRGARFCSRLSSEFSGTIAAIGVVSGIRFPRPNNATRPIPIMAFHGTADPINPYKGNGNPEYWYDSVPIAIEQWVEFNGCKRNETHQLSPSAVAVKHTDCTDGADVVLVKIANGGHTWPGSRFPFSVKALGHTTHEINASALMGAFFAEHPLTVQEVPEVLEVQKQKNRGLIRFLICVSMVLLLVVAILSFLLVRERKLREEEESSSSSDSDTENLEHSS